MLEHPERLEISEQSATSRCGQVHQVLKGRFSHKGRGQIGSYVGRAGEGRVEGKRRKAAWPEGIPKVRKGNRKISQKCSRETPPFGQGPKCAA